MSRGSPIPIINASELAQYSYCSRSWWLERAKGLPSTHRREMMAGRQAHLAHGLGVHRYLWARRLGAVLWAAALASAGIGLFLWWWGR